MLFQRLLSEREGRHEGREKTIPWCIMDTTILKLPMWKSGRKLLRYLQAGTRPLQIRWRGVARAM